MDGGGTTERGGHHHRSSSKRKRSKRNKAQASSHEGKVMPLQSATSPAHREPTDACMSLGSPNVASPMHRAMSDGASSRHFDRSKSQPVGTSKSRSTGSLQLHASVDAAAPRSALSPSKQSIEASRSKPSDERAVTGETHQTTAAHTARKTEAAPKLQDAAAPAVPSASETVARAHKDGAAAANVPVAVEPRLPSVVSLVAAPPKQQADHRRKSKVVKDRDLDVDNRLSMESFTPADVMRKSNVVSTTAQWSFYPMNVTFVTEADSKEERYLYATVVVVVGVVFALVVVAVALLLSGNHHASYVVCNTSECIEAQDSLARLLNTSKDACSDFYGYVCDSWLARSSGSFLGDSAAMNERLLIQNVERARGRVKTPSEDTESGSRSAEGTHVMRGLYQRCHRYVSEKTTTSTDFRKTLEAARKDLNWTMIRRASSFRDLVALVARTSLLAGFHTVFALNLLSENGKLVLRLSAGRSLLCKLTISWNRKDLEDALRRVVDDVQELTQLLSLDDIVADDLGCEDDGGATMNDESVSLNTLFADLVPSVNASDWVDTLYALVLPPSAKADAVISDIALMSRADSVRTAFGKIYNHDDVSVAAKYLASHLDADLLFLDLSRERVAADAAATASFCLAVARRCLSHAWPQLVARLLDLGDSANVLKEMYHELRKSRRATLFRWLMDGGRDAVKEKIKRAGLVIVSENFYAGDGAEADYKGLASHLEESGGADFVRFFVRVLEHVHSLQLRRPPTRLQMLMLRLEQRSELAHEAALHAVLVPTLYQRPPLLYSASVPAYFNYGTVGALLAARIIEVITPAFTASAPLPGRINPPGHSGWTQGALRMYNQSTLCLERLYRRLGLHGEENVSDEQQRRAMFLGALSLRLAYDRLETTFRKATVHQDAFSALWPQARAAFFARFCLLSCDADQRPRPLSPRGNCLLPLHTMSEFDDAFDCGAHQDFVLDDCML